MADISTYVGQAFETLPTIPVSYMIVDKAFRVLSSVSGGLALACSETIGEP